MIQHVPLLYRFVRSWHGAVLYIIVWHVPPLKCVLFHHTQVVIQRVIQRVVRHLCSGCLCTCLVGGGCVSVSVSVSVRLRGSERCRGGEGGGESGGEVSGYEPAVASALQYRETSEEGRRTAAQWHTAIRV